MWTKIVQLKFLKKIRNFTKHPLIISDNIYISQNAGPGTCLILSLLQRVRQIVHNLYRDIPASVLFEQAIFISTQTSWKKNENLFKEFLCDKFKNFVDTNRCESQGELSKNQGRREVWASKLPCVSTSLFSWCIHVTIFSQQLQEPTALKKKYFSGK